MPSDARVDGRPARASQPSISDASSTAFRWLLAALSFGAGAVHLVMVPQHAEESLRTGLAFAAAGWFQIAFGVAIVAAPRRLWLWLALTLNLAFVATWAVSRTAGLPTWTGDGGVEAAHSADVVCVAFEIAIIIGIVAFMVMPSLFARSNAPELTATAIISIAVVVITTAVLASPSTANHVHTSGPDHTELGAAAHHHGSASSSDASATSTANHDHGTSAADSGSRAPAHAESTITYAELPPETKAEVDQVIRIWATKYATAADATRDGWFKATRSLYGIGAHYVKGGAFGAATTFDLLQPNILLFDGEGPDAKFAGVSYVVAGTAPEGFAGNYDSWHAHASVCSKFGSIISLSEENSPVWLSESECVGAGGVVLPIANDEMLHVWIAPDYIDGAPIFAHDHPLLLDGYSPKAAA